MDILDLDGWTLMERRLVGDAYELEAVCAAKPDCCPKCGSTLKAYGHGTKTTKYRDSPLRGHAVVLVARVQRYRCREAGCGETFLQPLPGILDGRQMTERCAAYIKKQCLLDPFVRIADDIGCDEKTVRALASEHIQAIDNGYLPKLPEWLGIDETKIDGKMRCVITDVGTKNPIEMLAGRDRHTLGTWLHRFHDRSVVKGVAIDMWRPYRDLVHAMFPGAPVVIDKFHVVRLASYCMERVRIRLGKSQQRGMRRFGVRNRAVLLKRADALTEEQRFSRDAWLDNDPEMAAAYWAKEAFYDLYTLPKAQAVPVFDAFPDTIPPEVLRDFRVLLRAMRNWRTEILAYFDHPITNAYTEGLNSLAKQINRTGRGYSYEVLRARLLFRKTGAHPFHFAQVKPLPLGIPNPRLAFKCWSCHGWFDRRVLIQAYLRAVAKGEDTSLRVDACRDCRARLEVEIQAAMMG